MKAEKAAKYKELKLNKDKKTFEEWFLNYRPDDIKSKNEDIKSKNEDIKSKTLKRKKRKTKTKKRNIFNVYNSKSRKNKKGIY
jgi:hypothetical protein